MKKSMILIGILGCSTVMSCSTPTPEEMASLAAKGYYEHLFHGEYGQYLEGKDGVAERFGVDWQDYQRLLLENCHQFVRQQENAHRGVREIRIANAKTDTLQKYTNVFLVLCFGDSTNEEVVVPMVERGGRWRMK